MKKLKNSLALLLSSAALFFTACNPVITVTASGSDSADITFLGGFSKKGTEAFYELTSSLSDSPSSSAGTLFSAEDVQLFMTAAGVSSVTAAVSPAGIAQSKGTISSVSKNQLSKSGVLTRTAGSLKLTLGPEQILSIYESLNEESQGYLDLLLIPATTGDVLTQAEYKVLLSGLYGPELADEILNGKMTVTLKSPDGKKSTEASITLGELFTLTAPKSWSVNW